MIRLEDTSGGTIVSTINRERSRLGSSATGMVLTLIIVANEETQADATAAAITAARSHPMRIVTMVPRPGDPRTRLDADIAVGGEDGPGEVAVLRLRGLLAEHADSVAVRFSSQTPRLLPIGRGWHRLSRPMTRSGATLTSHHKCHRSLRPDAGAFGA